MSSPEEKCHALTIRQLWMMLHRIAESGAHPDSVVMLVDLDCRAGAQPLLVVVKEQEPVEEFNRLWDRLTERIQTLPGARGAVAAFDVRRHKPEAPLDVALDQFLGLHTGVEPTQEGPRTVQ